MPDARRPGAVPDDDPFDVTEGFDSDGDGHPDTVVTDDGVDLILLTDLDADGVADQMLRIGPDGVTHEADRVPRPGRAVLDGLLGGAEAGT